MSPVEMRLLCPACQTPLPGLALGADAIPCSVCGAEVDAARLETVAGKPRLVAERDFTGVDLPGMRVEGRIGAGGMGSVYRAVSEDGQPLAVKFLAPAMAAHPEVVERFRREIKLLATLDHPRIVKVRGQGELDGIPWFAMDLVEGQTLAARLAQGPLSLAEAKELFPLVFDALAHAHGQGVVHRDLKPANVLLSSAGPAIADFGIAHLDLELATRKTQLTQTHAILGTYHYMSPEQRAGHPVDHRSDLYSMGVVVYEALAGVRPEGAFAPIHALRPEVPAALDALVSRLLQPNRDARPASATVAAGDFIAAFSPAKRARRGALVGILFLFSAAGAWLVWGGRMPSVPNQAKEKSVEAPSRPSEIPAPAQRKAIDPEMLKQVPSVDFPMDPLPATQQRMAEQKPSLKKPAASLSTKAGGRKMVGKGASKKAMADERGLPDMPQGNSFPPSGKSAPAAKKASKLGESMKAFEK